VVRRRHGARDGVRVGAFVGHDRKGSINF
jgi:hypothetical protein